MAAIPDVAPVSPRGRAGTRLVPCLAAALMVGACASPGADEPAARAVATTDASPAGDAPATNASPAADAPGIVRQRTAPFDGGALHFDDAGTGSRALVLVHGWAGDRTVWREQVPALSRVLRCLALDLPAHGASDAPVRPLAIDLFADAVVAVLDAADVEQAVLVGHSNGVLVAREVLRRHPERVAGLVVVDGALRFPFVNVDQARVLVDRYRGPGYREVARQTMLSMLSPDAPTELKRDLVERMLATPQSVLIDSFEATLDLDLYAPDPIGVPLLAVHARSPFWTEDYEAFVRSLAPSVDYVVLDDVSHFLMLDRPTRFNELVETFVWGWDLAR